MSTETVRKCDLSTCRQTIPPGAKIYSFTANLRLNSERHAMTPYVDLCSYRCVLATVKEMLDTVTTPSLSELIKTVDAEPVAAAHDCHSLNSA